MRPRSLAELLYFVGVPPRCLWNRAVTPQNLKATPNAMSTLTTDRIASELLEETLLTLEQISTGVTVLAISATRDPEQSPRVRRLLGDLL